MVFKVFKYILCFFDFRRVIETWFDDEYKEFFYTREPFARFVDMGNITEQLALKKKMNCKSFDWFMKEVAYDVFDKYPKLPPNKYWGELRNEASGLCLDTHGRHPPEKVKKIVTYIFKDFVQKSPSIVGSIRFCHVTKPRSIRLEKIASANRLESPPGVVEC